MNPEEENLIKFTQLIINLLRPESILAAETVANLTLKQLKKDDEYEDNKYKSVLSQFTVHDDLNVALKNYNEMCLSTNYYTDYAINYLNVIERYENWSIDRFCDLIETEVQNSIL